MLNHRKRISYPNFSRDTANERLLESGLMMLKRLLSVLACGYMLMFYSEHVFWAHMKPTDTVPDQILTWLMYSLLAFAFLIIIQHFRVQSIWALFLAGAVFGWLVEGVIVQTAYDDLPMSISFTGLAWHALLSVWVGWYAVRKALHTNIGSTLKIAVAIGVCYGLWAIMWWNEPDQIVTSPVDFAAYAGITTLLVIVAYWIYDRNIAAFKVGRIAKIVIVGLLLLYFVFYTIPAASIAVIVLPALLLIVYVALRRNRQIEKRESLLNDESEPPLKNYLALLLMPLTAIVIYGIAHALGLQWQTNWVLYLVTTPLGFLMLGVSLYKVWRGKMQVFQRASDESG